MSFVPGGSPRTNYSANHVLTLVGSGGGEVVAGNLPTMEAPGSGSTFSEGNLATNTGANKNDIGTIGFQNGKWYWEVKCAGSGIVGVQHESVNHLNGTNLNDDVGSVAYSSHHGVIFHNINFLYKI